MAYPDLNKLLAPRDRVVSWFAPNKEHMVVEQNTVPEDVRHVRMRDRGENILVAQALLLLLTLMWPGRGLLGSIGDSGVRVTEDSHNLSVEDMMRHRQS